MKKQVNYLKCIYNQMGFVAQRFEMQSAPN
jgi:hypothetical protein